MGLDGFRLLREIWARVRDAGLGNMTHPKEGLVFLHAAGVKISQGCTHFNCVSCFWASRDSTLGDVANCSLLCSRRCGYSKAKQDPEEEKMHFHNGHSKQIVKNQKKTK